MQIYSYKSIQFQQIPVAAQCTELAIGYDRAIAEKDFKTRELSRTGIHYFFAVVNVAKKDELRLDPREDLRA